MERWVRYSSQTQAKERLFRLRLKRDSSGSCVFLDRATQYACTLLGYVLQKGGAGAHTLHTVKQLESHLSLTRKLIRLGNSAEALESAKRAIHLSDCVLRLCVTVAHLNRAMYFTCDNVLWAGKTGLLPRLDQDKWSQRSFRYYLFALILGLTRDAYEIRVLMEREQRGGGASVRSHHAACPENGGSPLAPLPSHPSPSVVPAGVREQLALLGAVLRANPPLLLDTLRNLCDLFIPLDRLGLCPTGPGVVGACGLASSAMSILTILYPWLKLKP